jgi:diguanylate cyclase (GGDEF)-like protein/PAS domain S-box-containing protein
MVDRAGVSRNEDYSEMLGSFATSVASHAIALLDAGGHVVRWNAGAERIFGFSSAAIAGRHIATTYTDEDVAAGKPARDLAAAAADGNLDAEGWRVRRDGSHFWAGAALTALRGEDGRLRGYGEIARDLSDRYAADLELRLSEERFRTCFDEARIGMLIIGLDGRLERVNETFCRMIGYDREQLLGTSREFVTHPDDLNADNAVRAAMLRGTATSRTFEKRYVHAAGHHVWVTIYLTLIRDHAGEPLRWIAQVQDITERRTYERKLEFMADHDPLTGFLNRRSFERGLDIQMARTARFGAQGALLMIDLDNFKLFNDTWGHREGDQLLVRIANGLRARLRASDLLGRLGGDEFAVLLPDGHERQVQTVAEALLEVVRVAAKTSGANRVTASVGIAYLGHQASAEQVLVEADLAMYDAKRGGGNRWSREMKATTGT